MTSRARSPGSARVLRGRFLADQFHLEPLPPRGPLFVAAQSFRTQPLGFDFAVALLVHLGFRFATGQMQRPAQREVDEGFVRRDGERALEELGTLFESTGVEGGFTAFGQRGRMLGIGRENLIE